MTCSSYDSLIATAKRMISEKGQTVTWRQLTTTPGAKSWEAGDNVQTDNSVKMVFLPNERYERETLRYLAGTDVPNGNTIGYMAQVSFSPSLKDVVIQDGVERAIGSIKEYAPNGTPILYVIEFRGDS